MTFELNVQIHVLNTAIIIQIQVKVTLSTNHYRKHPEKSTASHIHLMVSLRKTAQNMET